MAPDAHKRERAALVREAARLRLELAVYRTENAYLDREILAAAAAGTLTVAQALSLLGIGTRSPDVAAALRRIVQMAPR